MSLRHVGLLLATVLVAAACSFDEDAIGGSCVEGQQASCTCSGGRLGLQRCRADSTFAACVCSPVDEAPAEGEPDAALTPDPGTTASNAGASGAAGGTAGASQGAAGSGEAAGAGAAGTAGTTAGTGAGEGGRNADGGRGGTGGRGSQEAGEGGAGGEGGNGEAGSDGGPPEPGEPYSRCSTDMDCNLGLVCAIASQGEEGAGYCTSFCDGTNGGECPQPTSGTVHGMCLSFANVCVLSGCQQDACPEGMECMFGGGGGPFGTGGYCQYPPE